jgi:high-affinity nickel-transport protein
LEHFQGTWLALCGLAFLLGARHGFDADHLATIDGLTRVNTHANPRLARAAGALFSLGHGIVVLLVACAVGSFSTDWQTPAWLEITGVAISVVFLFGLAFLNARAVWVADPRAVVALTGARTRLLSRFLHAHSAWAVAAVGMLFALSFDTISLAALLALSASHFGGLGEALFAAALFVAGMVVVDGANGLWISRLIRQADGTAIVASRVMALAVAGISFAVGAFTIVKILVPAARARAEGRELAAGALVVAVVLLASSTALWVSRRRSLATTT